MHANRRSRPRFAFGFSLCFGESLYFIGNPSTYFGLRGLNVNEACAWFLGLPLSWCRGTGIVWHAVLLTRPCLTCRFPACSLLGTRETWQHPRSVLQPCREACQKSRGMFAVITPALMTGAFADRFRFKPYLAFIALWLVCPFEIDVSGVSGETVPL